MLWVDVIIDSTWICNVSALANVKMSFGALAQLLYDALFWFRTAPPLHFRLVLAINSEQVIFLTSLLMPSLYISGWKHSSQYCYGCKTKRLSIAYLRKFELRRSGTNQANTVRKYSQSSLSVDIKIAFLDKSGRYQSGFFTGLGDLLIYSQ